MPKPSHISSVGQWFDERLEMIGLPRAFAVCSLAQRMPKVDAAWHKVRLELEEVGLLYDAGEEGDGYLDPVSYTHLTLPTIYSV